MDVKLVLTMMLVLFFYKSRKKGEYVSLTLNVKYEACSAESWGIRMIETLKNLDKLMPLYG
jgi:hypothetical protein